MLKDANAKMPGPSPPTSGEPAVCVDCDDAKQESQSKHEATAADGLQLGDCAEKYNKWVDCIEENHGQAKACTEVLASFKECHKQRSA